MSNSLEYKVNGEINLKPLEDLAKQLIDVEKLYGNLSGSMKSADKASKESFKSKNVKETKKEVKETGKEIDKDTEKLKKFGNTAQGIKAPVGGIKNSFSQLGGILSKIGGPLLAGGLVAGAVYAGKKIIDFGVDSTKAFIGFEQSMNEVFTLLPGMSDEAMTEMKKQVKDFDQKFGVLSEKSVPALYQAISAGVPKENVFDFLGTAQKAAVGGVTNLEVAVDGITNVINAYGTDVISAAEASDKMFIALKLGKTNFEQLSAAMFQVTPIASSLGVSFNDVMAATAALTAQGTPTSVAMTQMKAALGELSKEGTKADKAFRQVANKSFKQFIAEGGNLQQALQLMEEGAKKSNIGLNDMFGSLEAGNMALALTGKGTDKFTESMQAMIDSAGATDAAYERMDKGLGRTLEKLGPRFENIKLKVGELLAPIVGIVGNGLLDGFDLAGKGVEKFKKVLEKLGPTLEPLKGTFQGFGETLGRIWDNLTQTFSGFFDSTGFGFEDLKTIVEGAVGFIQPYVEGFGSMLEITWGIVSDVLGMLGQFFVSTFNSMGVSSEDVKSVLSSLGGIAKDTFTIMGSVLKTAWDIMKPILEPLISLLGQILGLTLKISFDAFKDGAKLLKGFTGFLAGGGKATGTSYFKGGMTEIAENGPEIAQLPSGRNLLFSGRQETLLPEGTKIKTAERTADAMKRLNPVSKATELLKGDSVQNSTISNTNTMNNNTENASSGGIQFSFAPNIDISGASQVDEGTILSALDKYKTQLEGMIEKAIDKTDRAKADTLKMNFGLV